MTPAEMLADAIRSQGHRPIACRGIGSPERCGARACHAARWPCESAEALAAWDEEQAQLKARHLARDWPPPDEVAARLESLERFAARMREEQSEQRDKASRDNSEMAAWLRAEIVARHWPPEEPEACPGPFCTPECRALGHRE